MTNETIQLEIKSADNSRIISVLTEKGVILQQISTKDEFTMVFGIRKTDYHITTRILTRRGVNYQLVNPYGIYSLWDKLMPRSILLAGAGILIFLSLFLPTRILFIVVENNALISERTILDICEQNGLRFGCNRERLRSEAIRNDMLQQLPQLNWVGITTKGCVATVKVIEALQSDEKPAEAPVSSIVAISDGIIDEITVLQGMAMCQPGQAVQKGQILISGYQDLGLLIKASHAKGEVYAHTIRQVNTVFPTQCSKKVHGQAKSDRYFLQIGKNILNLSKCSGISPTGCGKMYDVKTLVLPGGFALPVHLVKETMVSYELEPYIVSEDACQWLYDYSDAYLMQKMIAGSVRHKSFTIDFDEACCCLSSRYICREQIGAERIEEKNYGQNS